MVSEQMPSCVVLSKLKWHNPYDNKHLNKTYSNSINPGPMSRNKYKKISQYYHTTMYTYKTYCSNRFNVGQKDICLSITFFKKLYIV